MTVAPAPPRPASTVTGRCGGGGEADLLDRLRSASTPRPVVDEWLAGGLRAWLEDGVAGVGGAAGSARDGGGVGDGGGPVVVRDGLLVPRVPGGHRRKLGLGDVRAWLTRVTFRLTVTEGPPLHPFEDALCAVSVTERGPALLDAVHRLGSRDRAALRAALRAHAATIAAQWRPVPHAWLPRTGERWRLPLAGGAVVLSTAADLVVGRPSDGTASVCVVRVHDGRGGHADPDGAGRALRAVAVAETVRSGAPPWRVASYEPGTGRLRCEEVGEDLLVAGVRDVLRAVEGLGEPRDRHGARAS